MKNLIILGQAYNTGVYGGQTYHCEGQDCDTTVVNDNSNNAVTSVPDAPTTGFANLSPYVTASVVVGAVFVIAIVAVVIKKLVKRR